MFVLRLANGNLRVPRSAVSADGQVLGDAYEEIGPDDPDYDRYVSEAITEGELEERKRRWEDGDEELRQRFEQWKSQQAD